MIQRNTADYAKILAERYPEMPEEKIRALLTHFIRHTYTEVLFDFDVLFWNPRRGNFYMKIYRSAYNIQKANKRAKRDGRVLAKRRAKRDAGDFKGAGPKRKLIRLKKKKRPAETELNQPIINEQDQ